MCVIYFTVKNVAENVNLVKRLTLYLAILSLDLSRRHSTEDQLFRSSPGKKKIHLKLTNYCSCWPSVN